MRAEHGVAMAAAAPTQLRPVLITIAGAWLLAVVAQVTGNAALLHHHALIEGGAPLWITTPIFLVAWQVMIAAMMLPASMPTIRAFSRGVGAAARPSRDLAAFIGSFALVWMLFGLFAFGGDVVLHHIVDATPWLAARPWLIEGGVVGLAGAYQLTPLKRMSLAVCRHPGTAVLARMPLQAGPLRHGLDHGLACLGSSAALMLLMFAEGYANLWWMLALTAVMAYEVMGRFGQRAAAVVGLLLLAYSAGIFLAA
jgi:predicted metal-binding membrane protein